MRKFMFNSSFAVLLALLALGCGGEAKPSVSPSPTVSSTQPAKDATTITPSAAPTLEKPKSTQKEPSPTSVSAPYYQGKTMVIIVSSAAGGGTDTTARVVANFLSKYIPGNPRMLIQNQGGGEGVTANNAFVEKVKPDGLTLIGCSSSQITVSITRPDIARYDPAKYEYVGNISRGGSLLVIRKSALERLKDPNAKPVYVGSREGNESWAAIPLWGQEFLGWNLKWLLGFAGTSETDLAVRRGEIDLYGAVYSRQMQELLDDGTAVILVQEGALEGGKIVRRPDFPDVPLFEELLGSKKPSGFPWEAFETWTAPALIDKWYAAPPGTPANIMSILTNAFRAMSKDPQFDSTAKKMIDSAYSVGVGEETANMVKKVVAGPREAYKYGIDLQRKFGIVAK